MSAMLPMAVYGLEVPAGDMPIPAVSDIPAAFRITMAAIDPTAEPEGDDDAIPRATLRILRQPLDDESDDEDDEDDAQEFDIDEYDKIFGPGGDDLDDDEEDSEEDEDVNGGPSDPTKSKKARREAAQKQIIEMLREVDEDMDVDELPNGTNGVKKSAKALGKLPAGSDDDEDDEDDAGELEEFVVCTLDPAKNYQQSLDITVGERERVFFMVSGTHSIYLTGNYVEPADSHNHDMYDPDSDDEADYDLEPDSDELDSDELDELDELENPRITELEEEDEDEAPKLIEAKKEKKTEAKGSKKGKKRPAEDAEDVADAETIDSLIAKEAQKPEKQKNKKQKKDHDPAATASAASKKDAADSSAKSDKKVQFAKELEQGPTPTKDAKDGKDKPKLGVKTVKGVKLDDKKLGQGPAAKPGSRVSMRYIGKLENGKVFDSNKKGKPFNFKLGAGEVIKGWEIGIEGMSVGSERRITIPPHLAYGSKGVPGIPANSTLVFDVKLLEITKPSAGGKDGSAAKAAPWPPPPHLFG